MVFLDIVNESLDYYNFLGNNLEIFIKFKSVWCF